VKQKTVHILSHTHWDREWYLDSRYTNEWLVPFFDNLFAMMDREPAYKFILDGQMSMIDDYFEQLRLMGRSEHAQRQRITQAVEQGRLSIGPYYLQPDWQLVSGEALVRNLQFGRKLADALGGSMDVGWLLDNFGQISQTAQIHAQAGIRGLFVWRGVHMEPENLRTEFRWQAPDGTSVPAIYMVNSYRNAMRLASHPEIAQQRIADEVRKMAPFNSTDHVLLMNGYDQDIEPDDVMKVIGGGRADTEEYRVVQSSPGEFLDAVLSGKPELGVLSGALYNGRYISVFPGVMSARMYLKLQNDLSQRTLERMAEPLAAMDWLLGGGYEASLLDRCWKLLLKNHPHDSICGVSVDPVHTAMEERHRLVQLLAGEQIQRSLGSLCSRIDTLSTAPRKALVVFNTSPQTRSAVVEYGSQSAWVPAVPGLGWLVLDAENLPQNGEVKVTGRTMRNRLLEVTVLDNGSFTVKHLATGQTWTGLGLLQDTADAGDLYNYSWPDRDVAYSSSGLKAEVILVEDSPVAAEFRVSLVMEIPEGLSDDRKTRSPRLIRMPVVTSVRLETGSGEVKVRTVVKNTAKNHVLRVQFPSHLNADCSFGGSPFDVTKRPLDSGNSDESLLPPHVRAVIVGAREPLSNPFFQGQGFCEVNDGHVGLAVLNRGLSEYRVCGEERTIEVTLFRSVAVIAQEIHSRLGDAGPLMLTPDGQCLREMCFEYAVYPHAGSVDEGRAAERAAEFNNPLLAVETSAHPGSLGPRFGLLQMTDEGLIVTAVKKAENADHLVVRLYNPSEEPRNLVLKSELPFVGALECNLLEQEQAMVSLQASAIRRPVPPKAIRTFQLELTRKAGLPQDLRPVSLVDQTWHEDFSSFAPVETVSDAEVHQELVAGRMGEVLFRRTALEAQISAIWAENRKREESIRDLGYQLNDARVGRRLYDYLAAFRKEEKK